MATKYVINNIIYKVVSKETPLNSKDALLITRDKTVWLKLELAND